MIDLELQTNVQEVNEWLKILPEETFTAAKTIFHKRLFEAKATTQQNATTKLHVRTGALKRSIHFEVKGTSIKTLRASLHAAGKVGGQTIKYAPINEYGGTIRAKNAYTRVPGGPYLNIPAPDNKTPAGVMRMGAREVFNQGGEIKGRAVYLNGVAMFYLVKSVDIPARLGMNDAADDVVPSLLRDLQLQIGGY